MINQVYRIEIDDLTIRCYEKDDVLKLKEAIDVSMDHLYRFMLWSHHEPESIESKTERTLGWRKDFLKNIDYVYGVFRGEKLVASTGLHTNFDDKALEIGYWVRADETRKGIATKLSCALTIAAMEIIKVDRVEIRYEIENSHSAKVPQKLKFQRKENYIDETTGENGRYIIEKDLFAKNREFYKTIYNKLSLFDIEGNLLYV